ncbi:23S rRNA (adenine(2503)-C(2))-methyltransferase RlmN [Patescibacteria group bacterium]|nr:23S rRNA (adenine(2503)-C(2))-methyltransferase RlmN [Patescibacteria group bacterium]MBU1662999.1 23S rRNA (adenine(2503)-C(2))-methyltransferase RlmN [Patescibacteria group bacterium]MBU1934177.1 23S rRNA (adenine(2503)-C(2))-methyltransferase RlmN [Patescibacteria group bacterium]MBU2007538.1 23S rRNA (adenine(2503)-C(2))-methyltransferase RlmN [Patescibacteria group bacterium]MBU2233476.1 23S rRNA (adenine(2503)-C(2))-methyltransferase RlmN [Patescibacteria group bacterium]
MNLEKLESVLSQEPKFRLKQARQAIFIDLINNWNQATNFPLALREKLNQECGLEIGAENLISREGDATKALISLRDGLKIETVLLEHGAWRNTVCLSSQVGCPFGCLFCATGKMGFQRNLTDAEIVEQAIYFARVLKREDKQINNVVFMGMGEPLLNYENVMDAIKILNDKNGLNIGARHISISTIGVVSGIKKLASQPLQINLAISLHAPSNDLREKIIPANKKYSLDAIVEELNNYLQQTGRRIMIEYLMIDKFNDDKEQAEELALLLRRIDPPLYFVNLIAYNLTGEFKSSSAKTIKDFKLALNKQGIEVTERYRFGQDIKAACG